MGGIKVPKNHHEVDEWGCTVDPPSPWTNMTVHKSKVFLVIKGKCALIFFNYFETTKSMHYRFREKRVIITQSHFT